VKQQLPSDYVPDDTGRRFRVRVFDEFTSAVVSGQDVICRCNQPETADMIAFALERWAIAQETSKNFQL
jgi:hypothetical protein